MLKVYTSALQNSSRAVETCSPYIPTLTDQTGDATERVSISLRASQDLRPVRNATNVASIPAGRSSEIVWEVLMAAAANDPVQGLIT